VSAADLSVTTLTAGNLTVGSPETPGVSGPLGNSPATNPGSIVFRGGVLRYSAANNVDYTGRFSTAATQAFNVDTNGQNVTWANDLISSNGTLTKTGSGTLTLNGNNTYSGITTLGNGTLEVSSIGNFNNPGSNLGTASMGTLTNVAATGATSTNSLQLVADAAPKTLRYVGAGETSDRAIYIRTQSVETAIESSGTGALTLTGPITSYVPNVSTAINTSLIFGGNNTTDNTFSSTFSELNQGAGGSSVNLSKRGPGTWLLSGNKTYRGITFVEAGTLKFTSVANAGTNSALGSGNQLRIGTVATTGGYSIALGTASTAGTLDYVGTTASSSNRIIGLNGNGTLSNSAALESNTLTFTGGISSLTSGAKTLTLGGANTGSNTLGGVIADGSGTVSLTKIGAGNWTLSNTNTYTGATSIQGGTLALTGSGSISAAPLSLATGSTLDISALSASTYTIANGLSGSGTINAAGKPLTISGAYAPGALTITGDVTFGGSAASTFLASTVPGASSVTAVSGTVQNAGTLVINPAPSFTLAANQSFTFVTSGGGITPGYSGVTVNGLPLTNSAGVWSLTSGNLSYTYTESNATLTLAPDVVITALQSWRQTYFGTTENSGTAADSYDYDSDGIPNLVEYATNTNPTIAGPSVITAGTSGGHLTLTFPRIDDPTITYTVKGRDDLVTGSWTTVVPVAGNNPTSGFTGATPGVTETVSETVIDTATLGSPSKRFLRLEIGVTP
jgi:autotransporter-associated beta strand protein